MSVQTSEPVTRRELCKRLARAQIRIGQKSMEIESLRMERPWMFASGLAVGFAIGPLLMDMLGCAS